jgi:hypothetical protein
MKLIVLITILTLTIYNISTFSRTKQGCPEYWRTKKLKLKENQISIENERTKENKRYSFDVNVSSYVKAPETVYLTLGKSSLEIAILAQYDGQGIGNIARYIKSEPEKFIFKQGSLYKNNFEYSQLFPCEGQLLFFNEDNTVICLSFIVKFGDTSQIFTLMSVFDKPNNKSRIETNKEKFIQTLMGKIVASKKQELNSLIKFLPLEHQNFIKVLNNDLRKKHELNSINEFLPPEDQKSFEVLNEDLRKKTVEIVSIEVKEAEKQSKRIGLKPVEKVLIEVKAAEKQSERIELKPVIEKEEKKDIEEEIAAVVEARQQQKTSINCFFVRSCLEFNKKTGDKVEWLNRLILEETKRIFLYEQEIIN